MFSQIELQLVKIPAEANGLHMGSRVITDRLAVGKHDSSLILAMNLLRFCKGNQTLRLPQQVGKTDMVRK